MRNQRSVVLVAIFLSVGSGVAVSQATNSFPSSGNVGIGTTAPVEPLEIVGPSTGAELYFTTQSGWAPGDSVQILFGDTSGNSSLTVPFSSNGTLATYYGLAFETVGATIPMTVGTGGTEDVGIGGNINTSTLAGAAMVVKGSGKVGIATTSPAYTLDVSGQIHSTGAITASGGITFSDGTTQTTAFNSTLCGGDYAESIDVTGKRSTYQPGDVLVIDPHSPGKFLKSGTPYSTSVAGIFSTKPGTVGRRQTTPKSPDELPMAMVGIVPVKVTAEDGPIKAGDLLVTSSKMGYAMKGADRSRMLGAVIGKALNDMNSGEGVIEVLITLQ
jgi:hypothetical protein